MLHALTQAGYEVRTQEHFVPGNGTLLEKLQQEIGHCDGVVSVMGRLFGEPAPPAPRATADPRSYTQWEHQIALGEQPDGTVGPRRPLVRALTKDAIPAPTLRQPARTPSPAAPSARPQWTLGQDADEPTRLQHRFVQQWIDEGADRIEFVREDVAAFTAAVVVAVVNKVPPGASVPNPWPVRLAISVAALSLLLLVIDATRDRLQVLMPPFDGNAAERPTVSALRERLFAALASHGVRAASTDPGWVPWPWLEPEMLITGSAATDPSTSGPLRLELAAQSVHLDRGNPPVQIAPDSLPDAVLDQLGITIVAGAVDLLPRRSAPPAPPPPTDPTQSPPPPTQARELPTQPPAPVAVADEIVTHLPDARPAADVAARVLRDRFSWPLTLEPTFIQVSLPRLKTRLTIAAFDRRRYTLDLIEQDVDGNGVTVDKPIAADHLFVANAGFFDRDSISGRLLPAGQMRVAGRDTLAHPLGWVRGALTISQAGDLAIQYKPTGQIPKFDDLSSARHLLQVGPVLVEPGTPHPRFGMKRSKNLLAPRIALCLRANHFAFVIVEWERRPLERGEFVGGMDLHDLAWVLAAPVSSGGLACKAAIALDGGWSTQYAYRPEHQPIASWPSDPVRVTTLLAVTRR